MSLQIFFSLDPVRNLLIHRRSTKLDVAAIFDARTNGILINIQEISRETLASTAQ